MIKEIILPSVVFPVIYYQKSGSPTSSKCIGAPSRARRLGIDKKEYSIKGV
jgi:hypothetical protein